MADPPERPYAASEPHQCKQRAENAGAPVLERLVWAVLAVAAELHAHRRDTRRR